MNTATTHKLHNITITARRKLAARSKPYYVTIQRCLTFGYFAHPGQACGAWIARRETGRKESSGTSQDACPTYAQWTLGAADELVPADGMTVLSFQQSMTKAATEHHVKKTDMTSTVVTVRDAVRQYLTFIQERKGACARTDAEGKLGRHVLKHPIADRKVNDLTSEELEQWQAGLVTPTKDPERTSRSQDTANRVLASFMAVLNPAWGTKANGILSDHAWRKLKRFRQVAQCRVHHFTLDEVRHLLASANPPAFKNLLEAAFLICARYGELAALNVGHLDAGGSHLLIPSGKTGSRLLTLTSEGVGFFVGLARGRSAEAPLILAPSGQRWTEGRQKNYMTRALTVAGLNQLDTLGRAPMFYATRHTHIS